MASPRDLMPRLRAAFPAGLLRAMPIRWRILFAAVFNTVVVVVLSAMIWNGARSLSSAWLDLRQTRESERLLGDFKSLAAQLQTLIHRYFTQPNAALLDQVMTTRDALLATLKDRAAADPLLATSAADLAQATERFVAGFGELRQVQDAIARLYEAEVLRAAGEMAGLYAIVEGAVSDRNALIWPSLSKSRDTFSTTVVRTNSYYLTQDLAAADEVLRNLDGIERTIPVMMDLAENELQRNALGALGYRAVSWRFGVQHLIESFANRTRLLNVSIDGAQDTLEQLIDRLSDRVHNRDRAAYDGFEGRLADVYREIAVVSLASLLLMILIGTLISRSIRAPVEQLRGSMNAIVAGDYAAAVPGTAAHDEIGEMARSVAVFRDNAIAKHRAEEEALASRDRAEQALSHLRGAQQSLIEAEKLAALGGLVAGIAHEVNNPVGVSLMVASSFERRSEQFAAEIKDGAIRKSRLDEFVAGSREAARQLVANLHRAAELIQSFKQVAVDRSQADRRSFDLRELTDQIVLSLRPGLKTVPVAMEVEVPAGIKMDGYPGHYGQVLTNLFLNSVRHGFPDGRSGRMRLTARRFGDDQVNIEFSDDGVGMTHEVLQKAFDPFFTTSRNQGGTGLGLHIVHNLVTLRMGGRITLDSQPGGGTVFKIRLPLTAPRDEAPEE